MVFSPFSPRVPAGEKALLASTSVSSCETSTILEEPLGRCGKKLLGERKIEPTSMRGASDGLLPESMVLRVYVYWCGGSWCGDMMVMWRGWGVHHKDQRRQKWWLSCSGCTGTNVCPLIGSKFGKKQLEARQSRQNQVHLAYSSQKQVQCKAGQSQGSWRVVCTWLHNVPFLAPKKQKTFFGTKKN